MKQKILLPTDFSKNALHAIIYALELYKNDPCDFYVLNVFSLIKRALNNLIYMKPKGEMYETAKLESQNELAKVEDILTLNDYNNPKHHFESISIFNRVIEGIKHTVEEKDIDMIVMGTKGKTGSKTRMFGSVAVDIMEKVRSCPVIVVPENTKPNLPKEIVFPTGYKTPLKRREFNHLIRLSKTCNATVRILHIDNNNTLSDKQLNNKTLLEEYLKDVPHTYHTLSRVNIPTGIKCFVESRGSDMVAFINKKHAFFGSIFTHPLVKEIGYNTKVPLLVMHDLRN